MKTFIAILCLMVFLVEAGVCAQPDGFTSHLQTRQGSYTWQISPDRLHATPEWVSEAQPVPLSLDKACQLGRGWLEKHGMTGFSLEEAKLWRYPDAISIYISHGKTGRRFYYQLTYRSESPDMDLMYVYVLLDGSIVEPKLTPTPDKKP
jgi:hypothetical protein